MLAMREQQNLGSVGPLLFDNLGGGKFAPQVELFDISTPYPEIVLFDVDGDKLRDVVLGSYFTDIDWWKNPGSSGPWVRNSIDDQLFFRGANLRAADLDGDGDLDLALAAGMLTEFRFYENLGIGAFGPRIDLGMSTSEFSNFELIDADLDGDLDMIATTEALGPAGAGSLRFIENQGGFQFVDQGLFLDPGGMEATALDVADVNGDGFPDILVVDGEESVGWLPGAPIAASGLGFESAIQTVTRPIPEATESVALDVDLDGITDVVSVSATMGVYVANGLGGDLFAVPQRSSISSQGPVPAVSHVRAADIDASGTDDLLLGTPLGEVWFVPTDATGVFGTPRLIGAGAPPLQAAPDTVDVDGDGDLDVLFVAASSPDLVLLEQLSPGIFAPQQTLVSVAGDLQHWVAQDFNVDGVLDLIALDRVGNDFAMELFPGLGSGSYGTSITVVTLLDVPFLEGLHAQDLNADGATDLVWIQPNGRRIQRALNDGTGDFLTPEEIGNYAERADAVTAGPPGPSGEATLLIYKRRLTAELGELEWFAVNGPAAISLAQLPLRADEVPSLSLADVNGDGDLDVLLAASVEGHVGWFNNTDVDELGSRECSPGVPNSAGLAARLRVVGSGVSATDGLRLEALELPPSATTMFITSRDAGLVMGPGGSQGTLCLGGKIGRFTAPGQVVASSSSGFASLDIDLAKLPQPTGPVSSISGESWRFQAWYRDLAIGSAASNFTDSVRVQIR